MSQAAKGKQGALFVMPTPRYGQSGLIASWIVTAGWAAAAEELWGRAWVLTPEGILSSSEVRSLAAVPGALSRAQPHRGSIMRLAATARYDVRQWRKARSFRRAALQGPWTSCDLAFVWQRHDAFHTAGFEAARSFGKPLILFVDAPVVWEGTQWGVRRPGWGRLVETLGERPQFRSADLLACVSDEVATEVIARGAPENRVLVTPNGVDQDFLAPADRDRVRRDLGLEGMFVVGWTGSFRRFHGLDLGLEAIELLQSRVPQLALLLVGDGKERARIEQLSKSLGLNTTRFVGAVPHHEVPNYVAAMDVALVLDEGANGYHFSPLKLREYMACGKAIIAPRVGEIARTLADGREAILVPPGDVHAVVTAVERLYREDSLRRSIGMEARRAAVMHGSWLSQVERAWEELGRRGPRSR